MFLESGVPVVLFPSRFYAYHSSEPSALMDYAYDGLDVAAIAEEMGRVGWRG